MKNTPYFKIFADIYNFMKSHYPAREDSKYWRIMLDEADNLYRKYRDTKQGDFMKALVLAVTEELERNCM